MALGWAVDDGWLSAEGSDCEADPDLCRLPVRSIAAAPQADQFSSCRGSVLKSLREYFAP
jgi:hypothetical protein